MSVMSDKITSNKDQERKWLIMANLYKMQDLLIGKTYRSKSLEGKIVSAEKHSAWFGNNAQAYLVEIDTGMIRNKFRVIAVGEDE
jgi:hypothetical protein